AKTTTSGTNSRIVFIQTDWFWARSGPNSVINPGNNPRKNPQAYGEANIRTPQPLAARVSAMCSAVMISPEATSPAATKRIRILPQAPCGVTPGSGGNLQF